MVLVIARIFTGLDTFAHRSFDPPFDRQNDRLADSYRDRQPIRSALPSWRPQRMGQPVSVQPVPSRSARAALNTQHIHGLLPYLSLATEYSESM